MMCTVHAYAWSGAMVVVTTNDIALHWIAHSCFQMNDLLGYNMSAHDENVSNVGLDNIVCCCMHMIDLPCNACAQAKGI